MSDRARQTRGQTLVLGCVTLLVMALMLMLSFNLTNAIHEKMRLQTHSDVMAYSTAVMEARSFNYFAYTNRASAALLVAQTTLHAYMSSISMIPSILKAGRINFLVIAFQELALCCACQPGCCAVEHCKDMADALKIAGDYGDEADDWAEKIKGMDGDFNDAVAMLQTGVGTINQEQQDVIAAIEPVLTSGQGLEDLQKTNAINASPVDSTIGGMNLENYACALEGTQIDDKCRREGPSDKEARARVMTDVANGSRNDFPVSRQPPTLIQLDSQWMNQKYSDLQGNEGTTKPVYQGGKAGLAESVCSIDPLNKGTNICASDGIGILTTQWRHGGMAMVFSAKISSGDSPEHEDSDAHDQEHDKFKGVQNADGQACLTDGNCFINFRSNDDPKVDFNQPSVYAAHTMSLRKRVNNGKTPWELTGGKVEWSDDHGGGVLNLAPKRDGNAISKAKVYFHRFDDWKFPPNMFDPYWRAKLHPFSREEAAKVAEVLDPEAAEAARVVVEGNDKE